MSRAKSPLRCWEYLSDGGEIRRECAECSVYAVRASWCFQVARLDPELSGGGPLCPTSCDECSYYRRVMGLPTNVLVVTSDRELVGKLRSDEAEGIALRFAYNAYEAATVVEEFLPAFAVVDQETSNGECDGLVTSLAHDRRLPGLKIVLAVAHGTTRVPNGSDVWRSVVSAIEKPFGTAQIAAVIGEFPVEVISAEEMAGLTRPGKTEAAMIGDAGSTLTVGHSEDGFLDTMADWDPSMAEALAEAYGIGELTLDHWKVIEFVQYYYSTYGTGPPVVRVHKETGLSAADICRLFPCGMVKGAYRLAGLPRPPGCAG